MESRVKDIDHGYKAFVKNMKQVSGSYTKVGYPYDKEKQEGYKASVAEIAIYNQFGTKTKGGNKHIPARSFFTNATDKNKEALAALTAREIIKVQDGKVTVKQAITLLGEFMIGKIRKEITDLRDPPNAASTIKAKGTSNPLIANGRMRASTTQSVHIKGDL